jgi:uncharacterized protein (DUF3084 family)
MGDLAQQSGVDTFAIIDSKGTAWQLSSIETGGAAGELEDYAKNRYRQEVMEMAGGAPPDVWGAALASAAEKIAKGHFKLGALHMVELLQQDEYRAKVIQLMLRPRHPRATAEQARALLADRARQVFQAMVELNPNTFMTGAAPANGQAAGGGGDSHPKAPA